MHAKLAVVSGLAAVLAAGTLIAAPPASASPSGCPLGLQCLYEYGFFSSTYLFLTSDPNFSDNTYGDGNSVNNNSWAAANSSTGGYESHYYDGYYYSGFLFCISPGGAAYLPPSLQDRASSMRLRLTTGILCLA
jgi:hypothetical protein